MPVNWDEFNEELDSIIRTAGEKTDARLASKIASITRMTEEEVQALFPKAADAAKVAGLMEIVRSAEDTNSKINRIVSNTEEFGGVILTLLTKFV